MGILNVTPDSFSDGGHHASVGPAVSHGLQLAESGAGIIDIGGESTRPGAQPVSLDEELSRTIPVIEQLVQRVSVPI
ncbi:MAG: dihydropteroate synthase, partial [Planctomycetaceae bacterium]|nr:dihydropteroate synthase [Planctomycetaceae bacterium]